jgi:hypothetical protein
MEHIMAKSNRNPVLDIIVVTAEVKKGKPVTLHVCPRDQKNAVEGSRGKRDNARTFARRLLSRRGITWTGLTTEVVQMPSSKAVKVCKFEDPRNGKVRPALCI